MILFIKDNKFILRADYSPELTQQIKQIPGAMYDKWEWTFPLESFPFAQKELNLKPAHYYPYLKTYIPKDLVPDTMAFYDNKRLILTGKTEHLDLLIENLHILCGYEEITEEYLYRKRKRVYERIQHTLIEINSVKQNYVSLTYPKGLHHRVKTFLKWLGVQYKELPPEPIPKGTLIFPGKPKKPARYYQEDIARKAPMIRRATIVKPTGSGKTRTAGEIIRTLRLPTLFLTDSRLLLNQTAKSLNEVLNIPIGKVGGRYFDIQPVTVATVQTIRAILTEGDKDTLDVKALKNEINAAKALFNGLPIKTDDKREAIIRLLAQTELLIVDEAHTLGADTIYQVASLPEPSLAFGLTATPQREDEKNIYIEAATGPIWKPISEEELIEKGYLLPVKVWVIPFKHNRKYQGKLSEMYEIKKEAIIQNPIRNALLKAITERLQEKYKTLLLVNEQEHAEILAQMLNTTYITSKTKEQDQNKAIADLQNRKIKTLIATPLLEQGVDIPDAELLIDAVPRRSVRRIIQAAGRIRRPGAGKKFAYIVTLLDLDDSIFEKQSLRKLNILKQAGFEIIYGKNVM